MHKTVEGAEVMEEARLSDLVTLLADAISDPGSRALMAE